MQPELSLRTDDLPSSKSEGMWREWMHQHFFGLESEFFGDIGFHGRLSSSCAGNVILTRLEASRNRVRRTLRATRTHECNYLKIIAPWEGVAVIEQHGRQATVQPGSWGVYDTSQPYTITSPKASELLIVMLPKTMFGPQGHCFEELMGLHMGGQEGISQIALEAMRGTFRELPGMPQASAQGAGHLIAEMVRLRLLELAGKCTSLHQSTLFRDRVLRYVEQHLRDSNLSIDHIARAMNCSRRHLFKTFAADEHTLAQAILQRRLHACKNSLKCPHSARWSITEIALSWGFSNVSYFNRVFRHATGLSPSEFRAANPPLAEAPSP